MSNEKLVETQAPLKDGRRERGWGVLEADTLWFADENESKHAVLESCWHSAGLLSKSGH